MATTFKNYDPYRITVMFNGVQLQGYASGTFVKVARDEDAFKADVGAGGDVVRTRNRNRMGTITVTLQDASSSNDFLSTQARSDESSGLNYGPAQVQDLNGSTLCVAANAWVRKVADIEYGADAGNQEWVIHCAELEMFAGGEVV